jgi:hypothetical protein
VSFEREINGCVFMYGLRAITMIWLFVMADSQPSLKYMISKTFQM